MAQRRHIQRNARPLFALSAIAAALVAPQALAQTAQPAQTAQQESATLSTVTVQDKAQTPTAPYAGGQVTSGGRMGFLGDKDIMETPFSVITYTEQFIEDQQATDITGVIARTDPTVFTSGIAGESNEGYSIRGFTSSINDVTLNGLAGMAPYYRSSPEMFGRIEVMKGPSAMLGGMLPKGSVGGSVNLVTKRAGNEPVTRLTTSYSGQSLFGGHIDLGRRFGEDEQFGVRFNGVYRDGETAVHGQDRKATLASLGLDWRSSRVRLSADLYRSNDHGNGLTRGLGLAAGLAIPTPPKPTVTWNPPWAFFDTVDKGVMARGEFDISDQLTAYAAAGISKTAFQSNMGTGNIINAAGDFTINFSGVSDEVERKSAEVGLKGRLRTGDVGHQFALNVTHYSEDYLLRGFRNSLGATGWTTNIYNPVWGSNPGTTYPALTRTETGMTSFGVADTMSFLQDRLQLTLGVRHQSASTDSYLASTGARTSTYDKSATTPAAAVLFKATDKLSVYGNLIQGLSQGSTAPATAANAGEVFPPYKSKQVEVGAKLDLGNFAHTVSLFEIKRPSSYTDLATNVFAFGGEQRNRGVEWGFFGTPVRGVRLMGGVAYTDAKITKAAVAASEGKQATGAPKWQGKLGAEWDVPAAPGLTLTANANAASKRYFNATNTLWVPGGTTFDLGARYATKAAGYPLTLRASVTNVANKAYWSQANFGGLGLGAPRTLALSASVNF